MGKKLEIGAGTNPQPGFIHTDIIPNPNNNPPLDYICDARDLPFGDREFSKVLMFGVFEHFGIFEIREALLEISRVLEAGGVFEFDVPDFDWFVHAYTTGKDKVTGLELRPFCNQEWVMRGIFGGQDGPGMFHKWGWNEKRLEALLRDPAFGFSEIRLIGRQRRDPESNHLIYRCVKEGS